MRFISKELESGLFLPGVECSVQLQVPVTTAVSIEGIFRWAGLKGVQIYTWSSNKKLMEEVCETAVDDRVFFVTIKSVRMIRFQVLCYLLVYKVEVTRRGNHYKPST